MIKPFTLDSETTKGHTCFFYKDQQDRYDLLANYFIQGIENGELCVFATSGTKDQVKTDFKDYSPMLSKAIDEEKIMIFEMTSTYLPNGTFVAEYMLNNVKAFIEDAKNRGFSGLRTAGEMKWVMEHPEEADNAVTYEHLVNTLNASNSRFVGLCLYPLTTSTDTVTAGALSSHPTVTYMDSVVSNPYYAAA